MCNELVAIALRDVEVLIFASIFDRLDLLVEHLESGCKILISAFYGFMSYGARFKLFVSQ